ncbi:MAG: ABC transporter ATP-binding protein [Acidobacteria bacterium]|jgi:ABC-2 type transport system ATP-binding protein|nr:MAG: ABC transporter ATP-binding protein [Acidobacteriota bacterium]GIU82319.1 MAG: daunorubicin resistance protein DrrA family ABC transporter ATP-binding protein [Pyrinomonadaceae bacterium]
MSSQFAVLVENISKTYPVSFPRLKKFLGIKFNPPVEALKNVSFGIEEGEIFGLIGKNGAGKTTLTKIIATLIQPTSGRVLVKGYDSVRDEVKVRSLIGLATAEERSFYWRLSCEQNMMFFARLYSMSDREAKKRIYELFEKLNLTSLAKRRFSELSTGNRQRLAVARALLPNPEVLLLDEPTRSLDPLAAAEMRALIASLKGVSILLTSHNLSEIEELCHRVAIISKGEIQDIDTPENLKRKHKQTEQVSITFFGTNHFDSLKWLKNFSIEKQDETTVLTFTREVGDSVLSEVLEVLVQNGAKILDVETEKPTLLDVLEKYENTKEPLKSQS